MYVVIHVLVVYVTFCNARNALTRSNDKQKQEDDLTRNANLTLLKKDFRTKSLNNEEISFYQDLLSNAINKSSKIDERSFVYIQQKFKKPQTLLPPQVSNAPGITPHKFHLLDVENVLQSDIPEKYAHRTQEKVAHDESVDFFIYDKLLKKNTIKKTKEENKATKAKTNNDSLYKAISALELLKRPLLRPINKELNEAMFKFPNTPFITIKDLKTDRQDCLDHNNYMSNTLKTKKNQPFNEFTETENLYENITQRYTKELKPRMEDSKINSRRLFLKIKEKPDDKLQSVQFKCKCESDPKNSNGMKKNHPTAQSYNILK